MGASPSRREDGMRDRHHQRSLTLAITVTALAMTTATALGRDEAQFPRLVGPVGRAPMWATRANDQSKPIRKQQAPLQPEFQARFEASIADQDAGATGSTAAIRACPRACRGLVGACRCSSSCSRRASPISCSSGPSSRRPHLYGRPRLAEDRGNLVHRLLDWQMARDRRRRPLRHAGDRNPAACAGRGCGTSPACRWRTTPRASSGSASLSTTAIPNLLRDEMTTIDNSLTRPWTVMKIFKRQAKVWWSEDNCIEGQAHVTIGRQVYFLSADGTHHAHEKKTSRRRI